MTICELFPNFSIVFLKIIALLFQCTHIFLDKNNKKKIFFLKS